MNPLNDLVKSLLSGGTTSDWLWCIEEGALARHLATRSPEMVARLLAPQSAADLVSLKGEAGDVAVIKVHGVMLKSAGWSDEVSTPAIAEALRMAAGDPSVRSILLDVDSPGGSAAGLVQLGKAVAAAKAQKPVIVQSSGLIASAAYFMSAQADKIYADDGDLIGSIGTRLHVFDFSQLFANIGIKSIPIDTGPLKSAGAFGTELTTDQREYLQGIVDGFQKEFTAVVKAGRGFDNDQYAAVATGGVFHVAEARRLKLIDGIRSLDETLAAMPKRKSSTSRSTKMENENSPTTPKAATLAELKENLPGASSDYILQQLEQGATLTVAMKNYLAEQSRVNAQLAEEKEAAEKKAAEAEAKAPKQPSTSQAEPQKVRGNQLKPQAESEGDGESLDYRAMARDYMREHNCRWSEACLAVKKQHPESRGFFGAPPKE